MWKTVDELISDSLVFSEVNVTSLHMQVRRRTMALTEEDRNQWLSVQYNIYCTQNVCCWTTLYITQSDAM